MLQNHIYDLMVSKGFTSKEGHLLMDIYVEVWREVIGPQGTAGGGKTALERFAGFLEAAPHLFEVFDLDILPMNFEGEMEVVKPGDCREKMVRLKPRDNVAPRGTRAIARPNGRPMP
jgi:hypothetical protein